MTYFITSIILALGVGFFVMQKITALKLKYNTKRREIFSLFIQEEWDSLMVSCLVLAIWNIFLYIIAENEIKMPHWFDTWGVYSIPLILGYAGQRLAYKAFTTIEGVLEKKIEQIKDKQ